MLAERRLSRGQRLYRFLFRFIGPAQVGLPPYATEEERARHQAGLVEPPARVQAAPAGFHAEVYRDSRGMEHRSLVRDPPPAEEPPQPS